MNSLPRAGELGQPLSVLRQLRKAGQAAALCSISIFTRTSCARVLTSSFFMTCPRCTPTVRSLMPRSAAITLFMRPSATRSKTSLSPKGLTAFPRGPVDPGRFVRIFVDVQRFVDAFQEIVLPERFANEIERSVTHGFDGHRNIAMPGDEDNGQGRPHFLQLFLQVQLLVMRGMRMSSTRQPRSSPSYASRKSWVKLCNSHDRPTVASRRRSPSRTPSSSSTIKTV